MGGGPLNHAPRKSGISAVCGNTAECIDGKEELTVLVTGYGVC